MRTDIRKLKCFLVEKGETQAQLAGRLGLSAGTVSRKMKSGGLEFSVQQVQTIADWLGLTGKDVAEIFFAQ